MRRLAALYPQERIGADAVGGRAGGKRAGRPAGRRGRGRRPWNRRWSATSSPFVAAHRDGPPVRDLYDRVLAEVERPLLRLVLSATRGNQIKAAAMLGLNRNTLRKKIRELDLPVVRGLG